MHPVVWLAVLEGGVATRERSWSAGARVLAAAVTVASVAMAIDLVRRADVPVEVVTPLTLGLALGACLVALAGAAAVTATRNGDLAILAFGASILLLLAVALTIFGVLVLPLVVGAVILLVRRATGRRGVAMALLAGPVAAFGMAVLLVIWVQPPVVECLDKGVSMTGRPWWNSESGSGGSGSAVSGAAVSTGSIETPSGSYEYRCEGATLTEFRRS